MTVSESRSRLRDRYIKWYTRNCINEQDLSQTTHDAKYSWWEREKDCRRWCNKENTYVFMSDTQILKIMRKWFKDRKEIRL